MLICRNEAQRYIRWVLPALNEFCDEIRAVDDASVDGTYDILREHGAVVHRNDGPMFYEHEGRARNLLLDWALEGHPSHLLAIDADELIADGPALRKALDRRPLRGVWNLQMEEIWKADEQYLYERVDGRWGNRRCPSLFEVPARMPRNWRIHDAALACGREPRPVQKQGIRSREPVVTSIFHLGWSCQADREERYQRYVRYDNGAHHDGSHLQSIMFPDEQVRLTPRAWPAGMESVKAGLLDRINR